MKLLPQMDPLTSGIVRTFRGLRTGDPQLILVGATLLAVAWLRSRPSGKEVIYRRTLKPGDGIEVKLRPPD
ncbi:MAG: hypothetical protein OEX97_10200 [Acidimicrobiia bacterium]|nr:hypothetical protein [Acidimicrobiia bacterium]